MGGSGLLVGRFKSLGDAGWEGVYTNIFWDRDIDPDNPNGQRFTFKALKDMASWANDNPDNMPELRFWHLPNVVMGKAKYLEVLGPFMYARGDWAKDPLAQQLKQYFGSKEASETEWAMSHGYKYFMPDLVSGEYLRFRDYELTVLPEVWAANEITFFAEGDMSKKNKGLREDIVGALSKALGPKMTLEEVGQLADEGLASMKALSEEGEATGQKDAASSSDDAVSETQSTTEVAEEAAAQAPATGPGDDEDDEEEVTEDTLALALADALVNTDQLTAKQVAMEASLKQLTEQVAQLTQIVTTDVKALKEEAEARKSLYPKAIADAIAARRKGTAVSSEKVKADVDAQSHTLTGGKAGAADPKEDKLGWFGDMAGIPMDGPAPD